MNGATDKKNHKMDALHDQPNHVPLRQHARQAVNAGMGRQ
jgi:hypothetical protein